MGEWPSEAEMASYVESIANIRAAVSILSTTPAAPASMDDGTVCDWNNIEQILLDVETIIDYMAAAFRHSGAAICGQGGLIL
jgi:hypothetical protein